MKIWLCHTKEKLLPYMCNTLNVIIIDIFDVLMIHKGQIIP